MQAIITKYLPATNSRGSRVKATCSRGSITVSWEYDVDEHANHTLAAEKLCTKFAAEDCKKYGTDPVFSPWARKLVTGELPKGTGYAHVFAS